MAQQGPSAALRAYADAISQGRVDDAYRMLSDEAKRDLPIEAFRRVVKDNPADARELAQALARPASDPVVSATVSLPSGDELRLLYEGGAWRLDAAAIDLYSQATPRQAIAGFLRAYARKRYDVVLRYVPDAEKEALARPATANAAKPATAEGAIAPEVVRLTPEKLRAAWEGPQKEQMASITQAMAAALPSATIEETGDSAAMAYGTAGTVVLLREHGAWKIRDF